MSDSDPVEEPDRSGPPDAAGGSDSSEPSPRPDPERARSSEEGTVRDAVERSRSGAPAVGAVVRDRFSSDEVFQRIVAVADEEITSGGRELFFSGLAAGFAISITFLLYVSLYASTDGHPILSALLYPLGFVYIIIGGYQLYTENTLPPVALTLERLASVPALLRHWLIVLAGNFAGGAVGAAVLTWGGVFDEPTAAAATSIAEHGIETAWWSLFFKAAFAGLIVAGVVWMVYASRDTISRIVVVYMAFLAIPVGNLFHVVVSFTEMLYLVFAGALSPLVGLTEFVLPVLLGNTIGGILLVTVVNYYQTSEHRLASARFEGVDRRLSVQEWVMGSAAGRSYVPLIDTGETSVPDGRYRVLVPISNPRTEAGLVELAAAVAAQHGPAVVHVAHVVQVPDVKYGTGQRDRIVAESERLLSEVTGPVEDREVDVETSTVVSHRSVEEVFEAADREDADLVVMGWGRDDQLWGSPRAEGVVEELTSRLPCDFLVLEGSELDTSRILLPTAGGPDSELSAEVARTLRSAAGSAVTLLYVAEEGEREAGEAFLEEWADDHDLADAEIVVDDSGDVERAIAREAEAHTLVLLGATERGFLARLVSESVHPAVVSGVDCSVLLAERPGNRGLFARLFGRR
ncbi:MULTISPECIES: formate/nitrite transporter family protein [Saliphagus]|uniref:Formate/nitrite transporter family protein n=1 Tax=Saliphagus infecundisoli TaxID=1849069 RepID=A0ABD5QEX7_9EURY|nr:MULTISPECIES: formate/nitrite transporter family protein [Saliphagus]